MTFKCRSPGPKSKDKEEGDEEESFEGKRLKKKKKGT